MNNDAQARSYNHNPNNITKDQIEDIQDNKYNN